MNRTAKLASLTTTTILLLFLLVVKLNPHWIYFNKTKNREAVFIVNGEYVHFKNGDIVFQTSLSGQSKAIQQATGSEYSHCGIIYEEEGQYMVFEAEQPVKSTPMAKWIAKGKDRRFVVKRLKDAEKVLTSEALGKMKEIAQQFNGKSYDPTFDWSDDKMYCSELIWKIYQRATGLELGALQQLKDFDLSADAVKQKIKERYGDQVPLEEKVISPVAIFNSPLLETVANQKGDREKGSVRE